jgi:hypothetical protein
MLNDIVLCNKRFKTSSYVKDITLVYNSSLAYLLFLAGGAFPPPFATD